jgi:hypothetical protein
LQGKWVSKRAGGVYFKLITDHHMTGPAVNFVAQQQQLLHHASGSKGTMELSSISRHKPGAPDKGAASSPYIQEKCIDARR